MHATALRWLGFCSLLCLLSAGCGDDDNATPDATPDPDAALDAGVDAAPDADPARYEPTELEFQMEMIANDVPGAVFAIVEGGEVTHTAAFGQRHPELPDPMTDTALFRVASLTKMMTAVALLQQVDDGLVTLDDPVTDHIPGFVLAGDATQTDQMTLQHLLTHGSGMNDHLAHNATPPYQDATGLEAYTYDVWAHTGYFQSPPDALWNYSNPGFALAGLVVELVTGVPYGPYVVDNVFVPLGMTRTVFEPSAVLADGDYAVGRSVWWSQEIGTNLAIPDAYDNPWGWPAGFAFSSVYDLSRFVGFLRDGDPAVLSDPLRQAMQSPQRNTLMTGDLVHYGYGLGVISEGFFVEEEFYATGLVTHNGALAGFASELFWLPDCDLGFVTLANTDGAYFHQTLETVVSTLCDLPPPTTPPDIDHDPTLLPDYLGTYHDPHTLGDVIVSADGTTLRVDLPGVPPLDYDPVLVPVNRDVFLLDLWNADWDLTFIRAGSAQAEFIRNRGFVARRVPPGAPPPPPPRSLNPRADLARLHPGPPRLLAPFALPRSKRLWLQRRLRRRR